MKPGDFVSPIESFDEEAQSGCIFTPFIPKPGDICTVHSLIQSIIGKPCIRLEEVSVSHPSGIGVEFIAEYWRVVDLPEVSIEELIQEEELV